MDIEDILKIDRSKPLFVTFISRNGLKIRTEEPVFIAAISRDSILFNTNNFHKDFYDIWPKKIIKIEYA